MENNNDCIQGIYSLDVNGSPSKMVVLSAKNNNMLADLLKVSANYLVKQSPTKTNKTITNNEKKKLN